MVRGVAIFIPGCCYGPKRDMIIFLHLRTIIIAIKSTVTNAISHSAIKVDRRSCTPKTMESEDPVSMAPCTTLTRVYLCHD